MKLGKDSKRKFSVKSIVTTIVVVLIIIVAASSMIRENKSLSIEDNIVIEGIDDMGKHINNVVTNTKTVFSDMISFNTNAKKVRELTAENDALRQEIIDLKSEDSKYDEFQKLKRTLNYVKGDQKKRMVSADVVGKNEGDWYKSFVVDAGADNGIKKDSIVINGEGVVGIVYSVNNRFSKAISIIDSRASVSFKIMGKDEDKGVITTTSIVGNSSLKDVNKLIKGYMFDANSKVKKGDKILTSGLGLYPENLPIGEVTKVTYDKNKSLKIVKIKPNVDFKKLDMVSIIPPRKVD